LCKYVPYGCRCPRRVDECVSSPEAGVIDSNKSLKVGAKY